MGWGERFQTRGAPMDVPDVAGGDLPGGPTRAEVMAPRARHLKQLGDLEAKARVLGIPRGAVVVLERWEIDSTDFVAELTHRLADVAGHQDFLVLTVEGDQDFRVLDDALMLVHGWRRVRPGEGRFGDGAGGRF